MTKVIYDGLAGFCCCIRAVITDELIFTFLKALWTQVYLNSEDCDEGNDGLAGVRYCIMAVITDKLIQWFFPYLKACRCVCLC